MNISSIGNLGSIGKLGTALDTANTGTQNTQSFSEFFKNAINNVDELQKDMEKTNDLLASGQVDNLHQATIIAQKADIALSFTMQVRNKVVEAYQEVMRMAL